MNQTGQSWVSAPPLNGGMRPVRTAFVFERLAKFALAIVVLWIGAVIATIQFQPPGISPSLALVAGGGVLALWLFVGGLLANVAYGKERYEFYDDRIVAHRGSLVSDQTTELNIRNVTHVKRRLPWPRFRLFGVGDVIIESAGSEDSEVVLRAIQRPDRVYEAMVSTMRANGFRLNCDQLLRQERPDPLGVAAESIGLTLAAAVGLLTTFGEALIAVANGFQGNWFGLYLLLLPLTGLVAVVLHYMEMLRRTYRVYADAVVYEEGFLTRDDAFIPGENIADASTRRGIIDRLIGVYDVQVSCQGSGGNVGFRRLRNGPALSRDIDSVVARMAGNSAGNRSDAAPEIDGDTVTPVEPGPNESPAVAPPAEWQNAEMKLGPRWTAQLRPVLGPAVAPALMALFVLFPLFPLWLIRILQAVIKAKCTIYRIGEHSVGEQYEFLSRTEREFSYGKITGFVVRENPLDRVWKTQTISVWSIGSSRPLELSHVSRLEVNFPALKENLGIPDTEPTEKIRSHFSVPRMLLATLPLQASVVVFLVATLLLMCFVDPRFAIASVLIAIVYLGAIIYRTIYYRRCLVTLHRSHAEGREGVSWRNHYRTLYENVKRLELTRYPGCDAGSIRFVVAGEFHPGGGQYATRKQNKTPFGLGVDSYGFQIGYVESLDRYDRSLDDCLGTRSPVLGESTSEATAELVSRPAVANSLAKLVMLSIVIFPLMLLLPITVPWVIVAVRRRRYVVDPHRVLLFRGILYRQQVSILHDRIDSIRRHQGLLGKIFGNGNVTLYTAGSSKPDLKLTDTRDWNAIYALLQRHYQEPRHSKSTTCGQ